MPFLSLKISSRSMHEEKANHTKYLAQHNHENSLLTDVLPSWFFLSTFAIANSKSSCVTCCRRSRSAYIPVFLITKREFRRRSKDAPASVHIPRTSAPEHWPIFSASALRSIPRWSDI